MESTTQVIHVNYITCKTHTYISYRKVMCWELCLPAVDASARELGQVLMCSQVII